jgi:adenosyl cobinamide kinase/adenosyl cobinamide phosphate guanylyltransferase
MTNRDRPFETIESAHEYLSALSEQIDEAIHDVRGRIATCQQERRTETWQTVLYTLTRLQFDTAHSRILLNDLRTLRNLLFRTSDPEPDPGPEVPVSSAAEIGLL